MPPDCFTPVDSGAISIPERTDTVVCRVKQHQSMFCRLQEVIRMECLKRSGPRFFGRIAGHLAARGTMPYHGRAFLADLTPKGYISPSAALAHPQLQLGDHVYLGDRVVVSFGNGGGPLELQNHVQVYGETFLHTGSGGSLRIGEGTHIQVGCHLYAILADIKIGKKVEIASGCGFFCYDHGMVQGQLIMDQPLTTKGGITIGDGAWLGYRVTVLQGVTIGAGAVIAAGSVVVHDIPENAIAAGIPARVLRYRPEPAKTSTDPGSPPFA
jgi:acetyltransferase-like isoleucine patch superfamily enzyme